MLLPVGLRGAPQRVRPRRVAEVVAARDTRLRRRPIESQRERVRGRGTRAPRLAQPHRLRLERDAVVGEAREERGAHAALRCHARERELRVDERSERDFLGVGLMRMRGERRRMRRARDGERERDEARPRRSRRRRARACAGRRQRRSPHARSPRRSSVVAEGELTRHRTAFARDARRTHKRFVDDVSV